MHGARELYPNRSLYRRVSVILALVLFVVGMQNFSFDGILLKKGTHGAYHERYIKINLSEITYSRNEDEAPLNRGEAQACMKRAHTK